MTNGQALSGFASPSASGAKGYNANVSIARIDHHFAAMTESPDIVAFNPCTLGTIGVLPYEDDLPAHYTTAHPHYDFRQKSMFNFTVQFGRTCSYHVYGLPDGTRRRKRIGTVETTAAGVYAQLCHDGKLYRPRGISVDLQSTRIDARREIDRGQHALDA